MLPHDVSAILLFQNDEEIMGIAVEHVTRCLKERDLSFELLAIDVDSQDNTLALLSMIRARHPELRVTTANPTRVHEHATRMARGRVLWFVEPAAATSRPAESFAHDYSRIVRGDQDLIVSSDGSVVAERARLLRALRGLRSHGRRLPRGLTTRARLIGLGVETPRSRRGLRNPVRRWFQPLMSALSFD